MTANNDLNKDEINWEDAYGDQCKLYKKTKKKLKKNRRRIRKRRKKNKSRSLLKNRPVNWA